MNCKMILYIIFAVIILNNFSLASTTDKDIETTEGKIAIFMCNNIFTEDEYELINRYPYEVLEILIDENKPVTEENLEEIQNRFIDDYSNPKVITYERTLDELRVKNHSNIQENFHFSNGRLELTYEYDKVFATPAVDSYKKVYDFGNIFTYGEEIEIRKKIEDINRSLGFDVVIITAGKPLDEISEEYASSFYKYNYFLNEGLVLLIGSDQKMRSSYRTGNFLGSVSEAINFDSPYMSLDERVDAFIIELRENSGNYMKISDDEYITENDKSIDYSEGARTMWNEIFGLLKSLMCDSRILFITVLIDLIIMFIMYRRQRDVKRARSADEYIVSKEVDIITVGIRPF